MRAVMIAAVLSLACSKTAPSVPCTTPLGPRTLYDSYCPNAPQGICFVEQPTNL